MKGKKESEGREEGEGQGRYSARPLVEA